MKNVLLIGSELGKGGAERSISLLSYYLQDHYKVTLCILSGTGRQKYYKTCDDVVFIDPPTHTGAIGKIVAWRYRLKRMKQLKKEKAIDVSVSFLEGPDYVNVLTRGREKLVLSVRGSKVHDGQISGSQGALRKKILIPWLYKKADEIVTVTDALKQELVDHFSIDQKKIKTIYNFYETKVIAEKAMQPLSEDEEKIFSKPVIISSGRLHMQKEFDKLITVFAALKKQVDARLMILGDGDLLESLKQLAVSLGLKYSVWKDRKGFEEADVYFMGFQDNAFKFYRNSKLFALSSSWEGFPNVLAEALICNLPVVTTDCYTGPREILHVTGLETASINHAINTEVGTLLPMLNDINRAKIKLWTEAMQYWLSHPAPPPAAFEQLTRRFTLEEMLQQWKAVINN